MTERSIQRIVLVLLVLMMAWSAVRMVRAATVNTGRDFFTYVVAAYHLRQGNDPYQAYLDARDPDFPITHLDGETHEIVYEEPLVFQQPLQTPVYLLLVIPFTLFTWPLAVTLALLLNLAVVAVMPWLAWRWLEGSGITLNTVQRALLAFGFYGLFATGNALSVGQAAIDIAFAMLLALVWIDSDRRWLAGIALGLAASKVTLALPLLLFLVYRREIKVLVVGFGVQLIGLLAQAALTGTGPLAIIDHYIAVAMDARNQFGIHIAARFPAGSWITPVLVVLLTLVVLVMAWSLLRHTPATASNAQRRLIDAHVLGLLIPWSLLVVYHRPYDMIILLVPLGVLLLVLVAPERWHMTPRQTLLFALGTLVMLGVLSVPGRTVAGFFSGETYDLIWEGFAITQLTANLVLIGVHGWLLRRLVREQAPAYDRDRPATASFLPPAQER